MDSRINYQADNDSPSINLVEAVGNLPQIPMNALDQPENHLFLNGSCFRLPSEYCGLEAAPQVETFFDNICHLIRNVVCHHSKMDSDNINDM